MAAPYGAATNTAHSAAFVRWVPSGAGIFVATWRRAGNDCVPQAGRPP